MIILNGHEIEKISKLNDIGTILSNWQPFAIRSEISSLIVITIILFFLLIYYNIKIKKLSPTDPPKGLALLLFSAVCFLRGLVTDVLGKEYIKYSPYFLTLFTYIFFCNVVSVIGFENPTALTTITFSLGLSTTLGTIVMGIKYQKQHFFLHFLFKFSYTSKKTNKKVTVPYMINPYGLLDYVTPWLSISLRLWANILAGGLIIGLFYSVPMVFFKHNPIITSPKPEIILFSFIAIPLHIFLDWAVGLIQAYVFLFLTMSYWARQKPNEEENYVNKQLKADSFIKNQIESTNQQTNLINISEID